MVYVEGYRLSGIEESLILDIIITFIVIMVGAWTALKITFSSREIKYMNQIALVIPITLFILYSVLTFVQPKVSLFVHSHTGEYGILEHYGEDDHDH